jgi:hypothetical protein
LRAGGDGNSVQKGFGRQLQPEAIMLFIDTGDESTPRLLMFQTCRL